MATHDVESIEVDRASHVLIRFDDGLAVRFGLPALRLACPCADCNAKRERDLPVTRLSGDDLAAIRIANATMAGAWGLNVDWSDGHSTGIYGFEHLRDWAERGFVEADLTRR